MCPLGNRMIEKIIEKIARILRKPSKFCWILFSQAIFSIISSINMTLRGAFHQGFTVQYNIDIALILGPII